ncbi:hypothetical protein Q4I30_005444 [Leishmania utingensis]|uniref:Cyclin dependent kinase-binding protein n=1 Tax=Leishmania utingensis TaxID=653362 RepID=A0AAW3AC16_9TRYP
MSVQRATAFLSAISPTELHPHPLRGTARSSAQKDSGSNSSSHSDSLGGSFNNIETKEEGAVLDGMSRALGLGAGSSGVLRNFTIHVPNTGGLVAPANIRVGGLASAATQSTSAPSAASITSGNDPDAPVTLDAVSTARAHFSRSICGASVSKAVSQVTPQQLQHRRRQPFAADASFRNRRQESFLKSLGNSMKPVKRRRRHNSSSSSSSSSSSRSESRRSAASLVNSGVTAVCGLGAGAGGVRQDAGTSAANPGVTAADRDLSGTTLSGGATVPGGESNLPPPQGHRRRVSGNNGGKPPLQVHDLVKREGQRVRLRWIYSDVQQHRSSSSSSSSSPLSRRSSSSPQGRGKRSPKYVPGGGDGTAEVKGSLAASGAGQPPDPLEGEWSGTPQHLSSVSHTLMPLLSLSSSSSSPSSDGNSRRRRTRSKRRWQRQCWAQLAATPLSLCTILTKFEPCVTSVWKENQVIQPYRGESNASSSRSSSSSKKRSSSSSSWSSSSSSPSHSWDCNELTCEYQDFVVNSQYLAGNYADRRHVAEMTSVAGSSRSSDAGLKIHSLYLSLSSKAHSDSGTHSCRGCGSRTQSDSSSSHGSSCSSSRRNRGSSRSSRSHSSRSSRSSSRGSLNVRHRRHHHSRGKGGIISGEGDIRSYRKVLARQQCRNNPAFLNAYFLDTGNITGGERRRKMISLPSYRVSMISFVDKKILKKDLNHNFYIQHPGLEVRDIKLTHLRKIKHELLVYALEDNSLLDLTTTAYAYWYFERLVVQGMVGKHNRKEIMAACVLLAIKFLETGDLMKKIAYFKNRWRRFHNVSGVHVGNVNAMLGGGGAKGVEEDDEEVVHVDWKKVEEQEFPVYVGLDFTLLPGGDGQVIKTHIERLLQLINVTSQEYYSKKFVSPAYLNHYNCYSNLYY